MKKCYLIYKTTLILNKNGIIGFKLIICKEFNLKINLNH